MYLLEIVGRSLVVYVAILVGLRLGGRRELGQLTPFDLVLILLVANAVQNAMVGTDTTLGGGLVAAATLLVANFVIARLRLRSQPLRRFIEGVPVVLIQRGEWVEANMRREGVTHDEVGAAIREHGEVDDVTQVELAVLETDGSISIVPTSANVQRSRRRLRHRRQ
jgi:uncharacterized membrane protein YcaP (DUF421 family)